MYEIETVRESVFEEAREFRVVLYRNKRQNKPSVEQSKDRIFKQIFTRKKFFVIEWVTQTTRYYNK